MFWSSLLVLLLVVVVDGGDCGGVGRAEGGDCVVGGG